MKKGSLYQTWVFLYVSKCRTFIAHLCVFIGNSNEAAIYSFPDTHTVLSSAFQIEPPTSCPRVEFILILLYVIGVIYMFGTIAEPKNSDFRLMTK